jgi:hypothetical protein
VFKKHLLLCALFLFTAGSAHAKFDPAFTWTTLETPHFYIHYHQGEEEISKRVAVIAEDVHLGSSRESSGRPRAGPTWCWSMPVTT